MINDNLEADWELQACDDLSSCWWQMDIAPGMFVFVAPIHDNALKYTATIQHDEYEMAGPIVDSVKEAMDIGESMIGHYLNEAINHFLSIIDDDEEAGLAFRKQLKRKYKYQCLM